MTEKSILCTALLSPGRIQDAAAISGQLPIMSTIDFCINLYYN